MTATPSAGGLKSFFAKLLKPSPPRGSSIRREPTPERFATWKQPTPISTSQAPDQDGELLHPDHPLGASGVELEIESPRESRSARRESRELDVAELRFKKVGMAWKLVGFLAKISAIAFTAYLLSWLWAQVQVARSHAGQALHLSWNEARLALFFPILAYISIFAVRALAERCQDAREHAIIDQAQLSRSGNERMRSAAAFRAFFFKTAQHCLRILSWGAVTVFARQVLLFVPIQDMPWISLKALVILMSFAFISWNLIKSIFTSESAA